MESKVDFFKEVNPYFCLYSEDSAMECIALKAAFVFPLFVLQKPHHRSKAKEHATALGCRLKLWQDGLFVDLLNEVNTIQKQFRRGHCFMKKPDRPSLFSHFMFDGKVKAALRALNGSGSKAGQPLSLSLFSTL